MAFDVLYSRVGNKLNINDNDVDDSKWLKTLQTIFCDSDF